MDNKNLYNMIFYGNSDLRYHTLCEVLRNLVKKVYATEMEVCFCEYEKRKTQNELKLKEIQARIKALGRDYRGGFISNKVFSNRQKELFVRKRILKSEAGSVLADRLMEIFVKAGVPEESAIFMAMHTVEERLGIIGIPHTSIIY